MIINIVPDKLRDKLDGSIYYPYSVDISKDKNRAVIAVGGEDLDFPEVWIYNKSNEETIRVDNDLLVDYPLSKVIWDENDKNLIAVSYDVPPMCNYLELDRKTNHTKYGHRISHDDPYISSKLIEVLDLTRSNESHCPTTQQHENSENTLELNEKLIEAVMYGGLNECSSLLEQGADPNTANEYGTHIGHIINSTRFQGDIVRLLDLFISYGSNIDISHHMHIAAESNNVRLLKHLYETYAPDIDKKDRNDRTLLIEAAMSSSWDTVKILLDLGADIHHGVYGDRSIISYLYRNHELLEIVLEKGFDPNSVDSSTGYTPLIQAILGKDLDTIKVFINHGASLTVTDNAGNNIWQIMDTEKTPIEIVNYLEGKRPEPN